MKIYINSTCLPNVQHQYWKLINISCVRIARYVTLGLQTPFYFVFVTRQKKETKKWNMYKKIFFTTANEHNWVSLVATIALLHLAKALMKLFRKNTKNSIWIYLTNNAVINRKSGSYFVFDCLFMQCRSGTNAKEFTWDLNCLFRDVILLCCFFRFVLFFLSFFLPLHSYITQ